jgi:tetratricopeptide (TPR) repeat protein
MRPVGALSALLVSAMALLLPPAARAQAQAGVRIDSNEQLFAVMCALHAAGYQSDVSVNSLHPLRARLRESLLAGQGPATEALRKYYREHQLMDSAATMSRYVSFALSVGPAPEFRFAVPRDLIPPEAFALEGFGEVLSAYYKEANIREKWLSVQAEYEREQQRAQSAISQNVYVAAGYLREVVRLRTGRTFTVLIEPLVGSRTFFRNISDEYWFILSPAASLPLDELRHAFLHFLLDPLPYRYRAATNSRRIFLSYAGRAPLLPPEYREDFEALLTECLVKAVELRLRKLPAEKVAAEIDAAEGEGYVLVRALYQQLLESFDKSEPAMSYYFPDLLRGIRLGEEGARLEKVKFREGATRSRAHAASAGQPPQPVSELEQWLAEGDRQIAAQNPEAAGAAYQRVLGKYPEEPRAKYGLAVASVMKGDAERAKSLFQEVLAAARAAGGDAPRVSPVLRAWSHVYLGRIYDLERTRELALSEYRAALNVEGAPESARSAARRGMEQAFQAPRP